MGLKRGRKSTLRGGVYGLTAMLLLFVYPSFCNPIETQKQTVPNPEFSEKEGIIPWRLAVVSSASLSSFTASYFLLLKDSWWNDPSTKFHIENDFSYALNLDKAGHFLGGAITAEIFYDGLRWSKVPEFHAYLWSGVFSSMIQVGIDIKDGFSKEWGYSPWDVIAGSVGAFVPMVERYVPGATLFDLKFSYWKNSNAYFEKSKMDFVGDDYLNQTYWVSFKVNEVLPRSFEKYWPDFIAFSAGISLDEGLYSEGLPKGHREVYLSLDWDLEGIFKNPSPFWKRTLTYINYIKFPSPTIQVYPLRQFHLMYPIKF